MTGLIAGVDAAVKTVKMKCAQLADLCNKSRLKLQDMTITG